MTTLYEEKIYDLLLRISYKLKLCYFTYSDGTVLPKDSKRKHTYKKFFSTVVIIEVIRNAFAVKETASYSNEMSMLYAMSTIGSMVTGFGTICYEISYEDLSYLIQCLKVTNKIKYGKTFDATLSFSRKLKFRGHCLLMMNVVCVTAIVYLVFQQILLMILHGYFLKGSYIFASIYSLAVAIGLMIGVHDSLLITNTYYQATMSICFWLKKIAFEMCEHNSNTKPLEVLSIYEAQYFLGKLYNKVFYIYLPYIKIICLADYVVGVYIIVKLYKVLHFAIYLSGYLYLFAATTVLYFTAIISGSLYKISVEFKPKFSYKLLNLSSYYFEHKILQRKLRVIKPLRASVGDIYYMEEEANLTLIDTVVNCCMMLLLSS